MMMMNNDDVIGVGVVLVWFGLVLVWFLMGR